jgi:hypothetical protein
MTDDWEKKTGKGAVYWPQQFTSVEEMINPFTPQAAAGLRPVWVNEGPVRLLKGFENSTYAPSSRGGG